VKVAAGKQAGCLRLATLRAVGTATGCGRQLPMQGRVGQASSEMRVLPMLPTHRRLAGRSPGLTAGDAP
jgi:hypothetical protein